MAVKKLEKEEIDYREFKLIGISTSLSDFTVCYHLNEILQADFQRMDDHEVVLKNGQKSTFFRVFQWNDEVKDVQYLFADNRSGNELLFPEIPGVDYVLKIAGMLKDEDVQPILKSLKEIEYVQTAMLLNTIKLKNSIEKSGLFF
ncbi:MAG TPA: IPExxxVDY family protein [Chitinophagales bacterium]